MPKKRKKTPGFSTVDDQDELEDKDEIIESSVIIVAEHKPYRPDDPSSGDGPINSCNEPPEDSNYRDSNDDESGSSY